jgi:hypothetical protein
MIGRGATLAPTPDHASPNQIPPHHNEYVLNLAELGASIAPLRMYQFMNYAKNWILLLFTIALSGLTYQLILHPDWSSRLLTIALLLLGIDQARMAVVDWQNIQTMRDQISDEPRLDWFSKITLSTIVLELVGFFLAWWQIGWGTALVLLSQIWFNGLAGVQLFPTMDQPIQPFGWRDRLVVLVGDGVGLGLTMLWIWQIQALGMAIGLLLMVLIYGIVKYLGPVNAQPMNESM